MKFLRALAVFALAAQAVAMTIGGKHMHVERESGLQDIVRFSANLASGSADCILRSHTMNIP
jgi:hypothetical protein